MATQNGAHCPAGSHASDSTHDTQMSNTVQGDALNLRRPTCMDAITSHAGWRAPVVKCFTSRSPADCRAAYFVAANAPFATSVTGCVITLSMMP
jgi:hypothetical protein